MSFSDDGWQLQFLICRCGCSPDHCATTGCAAIVQYLAGIWKSVSILKSRHCPGSAIRHAERMMLGVGRGSLGRTRYLFCIAPLPVGASPDAPGKLPGHATAGAVGVASTLADGLPPAEMRRPRAYEREGPRHTGHAPSNRWAAL